MGKGAPSPPDPIQTATAQTQSNRDTAITQAGLNAVNQYTPYGNLEYTQIGTWSDGTPRFSARQTMSDRGQVLYDTGMQTQQNLANLARTQSARLGGMLDKKLDFSTLPKAGESPTYQRFDSGPSLSTKGGDATGIQMSVGTNDYSADRLRVENALFERLNPQLAQEREAFDTSLVNRGIRPGSAAWNTEQQRFQQGVNDQRTSVLLQGGQEQSRLAGLDLARGNFVNAAQNQRYTQQLGNSQFSNNALQQMYTNRFNATQANNNLLTQEFNNANTARGNAMNEMLTQRSVPLNEILALSGQAQVQNPSFVNTPQTSVAGTDVAGINNAAYQGQMQQYNANNQLLGGLFSAGAGLIPLLSDRRAKTDIDRIGYTDSGTPIYKFRYKHGGPVQIGYMAQDLIETQPNAVSIGPDGFYRVQYEEVV